MPGAIPIFQSHPVGWTNPLTLRASAALPAAGAWDAAPTEFSVAGAENLLLSFTYTRGGAAGAVDWQIESSIYAVAANAPAGAAEWVTEAIYAAGGVVAGADTGSLAQREYQTYTATGAGAEDFTFGPISLGGLERLRIRARESGNAGAPGTLSIAGVLSC
jgi:hypothetical protein